MSRYKNAATVFKITSNKYYHRNVADFYAGKSVFITGGTGFLGKAFIEKLLYSTDIEKIYILIRETQQLRAHVRLRNILENPIFSRLKKDKPNAFEKVVPIPGDIVKPNLGISSTDERLLIDKVSVVIHSAATINFNEPLLKALEINYEGTRKVLSLCKKIKNVQTYVHISTAYSNTDKKIIEEHVYSMPADVSHIYNELARVGNDKDKISTFLCKYEIYNSSIKQLRNGKPNTYTFTKALAESLIATEHENIPTVIIRPTMVAPSINEPLKSWLDNVSLPTTFLLCGATGMNRVIRGKKSNIIDFVPIDYVTNFTLVAATTLQKSSKLTVYNCGTSSTNPIHLDEIFNYFNKANIKFTSNDSRFPKVFIVESQLARDILTFITQILPAYIFDTLLKMKGQQPRYVKLQKKFIYTRNKYEYFNRNTWIFKTDKLLDINKNMSEKDRKEFPFNVSNIIWSEYMITYAKAVQELLKQQRKDKNKNKAHSFNPRE
ncbi:putative fatty acyl-CoA reductase CG5065 [Papilio machaon]|uniref:putative fatty acyl-CoA reductase CG5065 n=1 Tax=Papilio machaon TaxID=76193 RepID=UPI001E663BFE|nr:putative fatty acyl-CoA reductase CG5065 [Papilio machaon]